MKKPFNNQYLNDLAGEITKADEVFTDFSFRISRKILDYLKKEKISKKEFAKILGKKNSQVSEWFGGGHNFTINTLAEISSKFPISFSDCFSVEISSPGKNAHTAKTAKSSADKTIYTQL